MTWKRQTREEQFSALFLPTEKAVSCCGVGVGALPLPPVISAVVALLRCTETVAVSLRIFPLVLAMLPQGNALQLVRESPSFWFSYSL